MASGGQYRKDTKTLMSESCQRSNLKQSTSMSDKEDSVSLNSYQNDIRPNNWDFSDWKPGRNKDQTKRRKKGNPEWEREQSLIQDSPSPSERHQSAPHTFPRAKIAASSAASQRMTLENIRQAMSFSDQEDLNVDDEDNNMERNTLYTEELAAHYERKENSGIADHGLSRTVFKDGEGSDRNNRNNNKQHQNDAKALSTGKPDSSQIVGRLMQIRDYVKQAGSMMDTLKKSGETPSYTDEMNRLQKLMDHLKEQERGYTGLLQTLLSLREEADVNDAGLEVPTHGETLDDSRSLDIDMQSEVSEKEERSVSASSRPRIEDNLGLTSENDDYEEDLVSETSENSSTMDDTVVSARKHPDWEYELGESQLAMGGVNNPREAAETLVALRQQQELLQKLIEQQEQMRTLRGRQAALLAQQQDAEAKLASTKQKSNEARFVSNSLEEAAVPLKNRGGPQSAAERNVSRPQQAEPDISDVRQQLQYLRNELKTKDQKRQSQVTVERNLQRSQRPVQPKKQPPPRPPSPRLADTVGEREGQLHRNIPPTEMSKEQLQTKLQELLSKKDKLDTLIQEEFSNPIFQMPTELMDHDQLETKLRELQAKKRRMDTMLTELHSLRNNPALPLNNALIDVQGHPTAVSDMVEASTEGAENVAEPVDMPDARQKLQKLNEVKERLTQLKSLVQLYESTDGSRQQLGSQDQSPVHVETEIASDERRNKSALEVTRPQLTAPVQAQHEAIIDESNSTSMSESTSDSETESRLSSLGPWGDDPEIQEKVRKLKAAKEKLKHLQDLVLVVQSSPGMAEKLPDNFAQIAASIQSGEYEQKQTDESDNVQQDGASEDEGDAYFQSKIEEQMTELKDLKNEKTQLLTLQSQLQCLHDKFTKVGSGQQQEGQETPDESRTKSSVQKQPDVQQQSNQHQSVGPSVTFSSNDEVYYKMRNQRMLREELRDKKKQLESIMKKDRNKKQYFKNQDNQSDTVSFSTEMFGMGASVDQTMATWGGSTADNLESITEDGAAQDNDDDDEDDDAYPLDGILQVEEEEEENQSDNETYTIEDDVRQRRKARAVSKQRKTESSSKSKRSFPQPRHPGDTSNFNNWSREGRKNKQENYRSTEDVPKNDDSGANKTAMEELQRKLEETSLLCQTVLGENQSAALLNRQSAAGFGSHSQLDLQQQLQQQQLMMSLNQCYQQISMQQMEMQGMQRQMQSLVYQMTSEDINESGFSSDLRVRSMSSLYSPMLPRQSPNILLPPGDAFHFNPVYQHASPTSNRLLRRAADTESLNRSDIQDGLDRQRLSSRQSAQDAIHQRRKKKSGSPPLLNNSQLRRPNPTPGQMYMHEENDDAYSQEKEAFEDYLSRKRREFLDRNHLPDKLSSQNVDTGTRQSLRSKLVSSDNQQYRPGLSAGISGAGYAEDEQSIISSIQSSICMATQANETHARESQSQRDGEDTMEMSLFETLRETIYSEVATLISQNENRPHYLIELFRELQSLTTDYLRQRVLYDIKDVVSKYLVEENSVPELPPPWMKTTKGNFTDMDLTPSESNVTTDDEEVKAKLQQKIAADTVAKERRKAAQLRRSGSLKNDEFDYQEQAEVTSSVSTPSNPLWESPFASDSLGETAIDLDKALEKMKEYEMRLAAKTGKVTSASEVRGSDVCEVSSSAMDQGDESSVNSESVPYPRIDTQQLDQQIKSIMTEVIPVIKEHMDNMCSPQLLAYIKRLVLSLTRQYDSGEEFARFFHRQLGSIMQDTLAKYEGRKMRECGEDLLVDMSEVLFNELAFFKLMQDLDDPLIAEKMNDVKTHREEEQPASSKEELDVDGESENESDTSESSTASISENQDDTRPTHTEEEDLGKMRDDEFASVVEVQDADNKDEDTESPIKGVQIELAPSETKPYTRIGSDEDDESADDESQSNEDDPSETAVSINARKITDSVHTEDNEDSVTKQDGTCEVGVNSKGAEGKKVQIPVSQTGHAACNGNTETQTLELINGDVLCGDIEVITMDDLPASLTVMSHEDLQQRLTEEEQVNVAAAILGATEAKQELAGDPQFLKEPDVASG